jgi:hypothetical protein
MYGERGKLAVEHKVWKSIVINQNSETLGHKFYIKLMREIRITYKQKI